MRKFIGILGAFAFWAIAFMFLAKFIQDTKVFKIVALVIVGITVVTMFISNAMIHVGRSFLLLFIYAGLAFTISLVPHFSLLSGAFILVPLFLYSARYIR